MSTPDQWSAYAVPQSAAPASTVPAADPWAQYAQKPADPWAQYSVSPTAPETAKPEDTSTIGKAWDWLNTPLLNLQREGAGPIESGAESFASDLTSPVSLLLTVGTLGGGAAEDVASQGLMRLGLVNSATEGAAAVQKMKLGMDLGFLTKYGYDLGTNTIPQMELNWGDYRAAKTDKDKQAALDRLKEFGTESILNAVAAGLATHGVAHDIAAIRASSPKGLAMANTQYADAAHEIGLDYDLGSSQAAQDMRVNTKLIPEKSKMERSEVYFNREAGGDPNKLEQWAQALEKAPEKWQREFAPIARGAMKLDENQLAVRDYIGQRYNADAEYLKLHNALPEDYNPYYQPHKQLYEDLDPETGKPVDNVQRGDEDFLKARTFPTIFDSIMHGVKPETTDAIRLQADYHVRAMNYVAEQNYAKALSQGYLNNGLPMAAPGHLLPGRTTALDAPLSPEEVAKMKESGVFDELLRKGEIYPAKPKAARVGAPETETALATIPKNQLEAGPEAKEIPRETEPEVTYMIRQKDYVPTRLSMWIPKAVAGPGETAIVPFGQGPFPEQAIMEPGMKGIPGAEPPEKIPNVRVPLFVHPEIAPHVEAVLASWRPENPILRAALKVGSEAKSSLLALSPFHWFTIMDRALESGINPFKNSKYLILPKDIDYYNLSDAQTRAMRAGVVARSARRGFSNYIGEGLEAEHDSLINRIPLVGSFNRAIEENLFGAHGKITALKFQLFDKLSGEIRKSRPDLTETQADRIAASQVNNKFGGLNYTVLGRGASTQNALRMLLLAPDFLESSARSVLDVAGKNGATLVKSLVAFNVFHWLMARSLNYLISGDTRPQSGFSVLSKDGKREYNLRTTLGDFLHFAEKPRDFLANRVNPIGVRAPAELMAEEDEFGEKVTNTQEFFDTLRQISPIPLQGLLPENTIAGPSATDRMLQSIGVQSRKKFTPAETLAQQLESRHTPTGEGLEGEELEKAQLRYRMEDRLRTAINARDSAERVAAIRDIHEASVGPDAKLTPDEASKLIENANKYPLRVQSSIEHLGLADALEVWTKASIIEKRAIRPIIQGKISRYLAETSKHTQTDNANMQKRILAFRNTF